jgi:hypothetical protein
MPLEQPKDNADVCSRLFVVMYQSEALWIGLNAAAWRPNAVLVLAGSVNVISGKVGDDRLSRDPQNYVTCPKQPWLDGFNTDAGVVRQFVALPLGLGQTAEEQLSQGKPVGGLRIIVYDPKPGVFPDRLSPSVTELPKAASGMGLGAGGLVRQKIYPDPFGLDVWDERTRTEVQVRILNTFEFRETTGRTPPAPMITVKQYSDAGLPWFQWYDEHEADVASSQALSQLHTVGEDLAEEQHLNPRTLPIRKLGTPNNTLINKDYRHEQ